MGEVGFSRSQVKLGFDSPPFQSIYPIYSKVRGRDPISGKKKRKADLKGSCKKFFPWQHVVPNWSSAGPAASHPMIKIFPRTASSPKGSIYVFDKAMPTTRSIKKCWTDEGEHSSSHGSTRNAKYEVISTLRGDISRLSFLEATILDQTRHLKVLQMGH